MVIVLVSSICVCSEFLPCITGLNFWKKLFIMDLMVEHVSITTQFRLMILVVGASFVVWVMVILTCCDFDPVRVLDVDYGQFSA